MEPHQQERRNLQGNVPEERLVRRARARSEGEGDAAGLNYLRHRMILFLYLDSGSILFIKSTHMCVD